MMDVEKKISFIPLENASVDISNEKELSFRIRDKYRGIIFKSLSKEDMFLWYVLRYLGLLQLVQP
jgi:hypothetical protein